MTNEEFIKQMIDDKNTISLMYEHIKYEMCEHYCKYPHEWDAEKEGKELYESEICANCPINVL